MPSPGGVDTTWLLIFDNAPNEDYSFFREYQPSNGFGSILVTTRNATLAREFSIKHEIALGPLDGDSAVKMLLGNLSEYFNKGSKEKAQRICKRLGNLPLALSQMSGYLEESGCSLEKFLDLYEDYENHPGLHSTSKPGSTTGYQHTVSTVWAITISLLEQKSEEAVRTLSILAFLDSDGLSSRSNCTLA